MTILQPPTNQYAPPSSPRPPRPARTPWARTAALALAAGLAGGLASGPFGVLLTTPPAPATPSPTPAAVAPLVAGSAPDWAAVAATAGPSVVSVDLRTSQGGDAGSGVVWDAQGHVVTNNHVVAAAGPGATLTVTLWDQRTYPATVVGTDPTTDLAVLQIQGAPASLAALPRAAGSVKVGDPVLALGNPLGLSGTVTSGIVSAVARPVATASENGGQPVVTNAIQTSAAVNPGNSGGALVDATGSLIGINSSIASVGQSQGQSGNIGIGFAIPTHEVELIVPQLIASGSAQHAFLGISTHDVPITKDGYQTTGAGVATVVAGGPSASALQPGDIITALEGSPVSGTESLIGLVRDLPVGRPVMVSYVRDGQASSAQVVLGAAPTGATR